MKQHKDLDPSNIQDEEYQLHDLMQADFQMTDELFFRKQAEELRKKHKIVLEKNGELI